MKQASFQIGNSVNKEKNNVSEYITNVPNVKKYYEMLGALAPFLPCF